MSSLSSPSPSSSSSSSSPSSPVSGVSHVGPYLLTFNTGAKTTAPKRIIIVGAGGRLGLAVLKEAVTIGHHVVAVVRNEAKFREAAAAARVPINNNVSIAVGSASDRAFLVKTFAGADSVISSFGSLDFSELVSDNKSVIDATVEAKVPNFVNTASNGVLNFPWYIPGEKKSGYYMEISAPAIGEWALVGGGLFVQVREYLKTKTSLNWATLAPGWIISQPSASPVIIASPNEFIGGICTYEDIAAWCIAHVHSLSTSPFNRTRVGFTMSFPPVSTGIPSSHPAWIAGAIEGVRARMPEYAARMKDSSTSSSSSQANK